MRRPPALREGDRIALIAPASPFDAALFERGVEEVRALGFMPVFASSVFERRAYVAGPAEGRASAFAAAWGDPSIAGVFAVRGGYGSAQVLPWLDADEMRKGRKVLLGCSDVTALLSYVTTRCGLVAFHGPMLVHLAAGDAGYDRVSLLAQLMRARPYGELAAGGLEVLKRGRARGPLLGGTLTQLAASLGTPFAFDPPPGFVLLLDDVDERPYGIDRMLVQLRQAGVVSRAAAVVCAEFPGCDEPETGPTARSVIADLLGEVPGPVLFGLPTGHAEGPLLTVPLGVSVSVEGTSTGRLILEEAAVE